MRDPRLDKLADILVNYSVEAQPKQWVAVRSGIEGLPLVHAVVEKILQAGANPTIYINDAETEAAILRYGSDDQLNWMSPLEWANFCEADALVIIRADSNNRSLSGIDPARQAMRLKARGELTQTYLRRTNEGTFKWILTNYPSNAYAQDADMNLKDYEDFVFSATGADLDDPVAYWKNRRADQQRLVDWLQGKKQIIARGPNIDMTLSIEGRTFINDSGGRNMPGGEIFTGPVEESVNGWVRFTYPAIRNGNEVEGVEFTFEEGKVVKATAEKNEAYLLSELDTDPGARYLGEFAIGTNYGIQRFTRSILYDEKIGGTLHMAVGLAYESTGGRNKSAIHWDFICDMREDSEILVDGELFYKNGAFQI
jgi:aminopeptidase